MEAACFNDLRSRGQANQTHKFSPPAIPYVDKFSYSSYTGMSEILLFAMILQVVRPYHTRSSVVHVRTLYIPLLMGLQPAHGHQDLLCLCSCYQLSIDLPCVRHRVSVRSSVIILGCSSKEEEEYYYYYQSECGSETILDNKNAKIVPIAHSTARTVKFTADRRNSEEQDSC